MRREMVCGVRHDWNIRTIWERRGSGEVGKEEGREREGGRE